MRTKTSMTYNVSAKSKYKLQMWKQCGLQIVSTTKESMIIFGILIIKINQMPLHIYSFCKGVLFGSLMVLHRTQEAGRCINRF